MSGIFGRGGLGALATVAMPNVSNTIKQTVCPAGQVASGPLGMGLCLPICPGGRNPYPWGENCVAAPVVCPTGQINFGGGCTSAPSLPPGPPGPGPEATIPPAPVNGTCAAGFYYYCPTKSCIPNGISTPAIMPGQCESLPITPSGCLIPLGHGNCATAKTLAIVGGAVAVLIAAGVGIYLVVRK